MRRASPYSYAVLERLLREHFPFPRHLLQLHALLLTSGALLLPAPDRSAAAFPYNCLAHAHLRLSASSSSASPPSAPLRLFSAMLASGARPNRHSFLSLLKSASASGSASAAGALHAQCLRRGLAADRFVACSLVSAYGRTGRPARDARKVFDEMEGSPDLAACNALLDALCLAGDLEAAETFFRQMAARDAVSWTTLVSGLSRGGRHRCALEVFREFLLDNSGQRLGEATLVSVLSACANLDDAEGLAAGMAVHAYIVRHELDLTAFLGTALVDMYGKHGRLDRCRSAFDAVNEKEVCTWNALLLALANHGMETEAMLKFDVMRAEGFLPNQITFLALLTACARAGLVELGLYWFEAMVVEYKVTPLMVHYGCVVDLLGRAGRFVEAIQVIEKMPFAPDSSVLGALLGACKLHGNVELAVETGQKLIALGPQQSGRYVTIRNVYLEDGNWHAGARMGEVMQEVGIKKTVGQSSVVLHGVSSHCSCPPWVCNFKAITHDWIVRKELNCLATHMKKRHRCDASCLGTPTPSKIPGVQVDQGHTSAFKPGNPVTRGWTWRVSPVIQLPALYQRQCVVSCTPVAGDCCLASSSGGDHYVHVTVAKTATVLCVSGLHQVNPDWIFFASSL